MINVLFIEDDEHTQSVLRNVLSDDFYIIPSQNGEQGIEKVETEGPDVVLLDIGLPDIDGLEVLRRIVSKNNSPPVVMLTCFSETETVVKAMKSGACDYITKPYDPFQLRNKLLQAFNSKSVIPAVSEDEEKHLYRFIGESPKMREIKNLILRYSQTDKTVLISGESGTGKDVAAWIIHALSSRSNGPFVPVNCGAIPAQLFESELFGSVRGAFTDAVTREGSFEHAEGGTLFLNEIGEIPYHLQVKLLQAIEYKHITRVGSNRNTSVNTRIIAATNRDLKTAIAEGGFRGDLFYRINILKIELPPLRERREDIKLLAFHFLRSISSEHSSLLAGTLDKLQNYSWPGNIRELKNTIERAVVYAPDHTIRPQDIVFY